MALPLGSWQDLLDFSADPDNTGSLEAYWNGDDVVDFDALGISPFYDTVTIKGVIDFNGVTFRNMTWYQPGNNGCLYFITGKNSETGNNTVKNLVIDQLTYEPTSQSNNKVIIKQNIVASSNAHFENCKFGLISYASASSASNSPVQFFYSNGTTQSCAFNLKSVCNTGYIQMSNGSTSVMRDCLFDLDIKYNSNSNIEFGNMYLTNCLIRGKVENEYPNTLYPPKFVNSNNKYNNYLLEGTYNITSAGGVSIYDNTKMILTTSPSSMIGYDPSNPDMGALADAGFPCAGG